MKKILIVWLCLWVVGSMEVLAQKKTSVKKSKTTKTQPIEKVGSTGESGKAYVSTEGKFKIIFPAPPVVKVTERGEGDLRLRSVTHRAFGGALGYGVTFTDSFSSAGINNEKNIESLRNLIATGGEVVKETKLTLNEVIGLEIVYKGATQSLSQHRIYSVGKRWYEVVVVYPFFSGEDPEIIIAKNKAEVDRFFASFQILK